MNELDALRAVDFDWAMHLRSIWTDPPHDVPQLNERLRGEIRDKLDAFVRDPSPLSPLGWVIVGSGGTGKTHLLSILRREALARRMGFVLVDMTDVHDFWETVLQGYLDSLQQAYEDERYQHEILLELFIGTLGPKDPLSEAMRKLRRAKTKRLAENCDRVLQALARRHRQQTQRCRDVIRALIALNSEDMTISSVGLTWLQAHAIDDEDKRALGFSVAQMEAREIVRALSWIMSLVGPTVLAFDQLDPIVAELNIAAGARADEQADEQIVVARSIIERIARGFGALHDITQRTLAVISCLEVTWENLLQKVALRANVERFEPSRTLRPVPPGDVAAAVVRNRLAPAYQSVGFEPPYPTWPFARQAFDPLQGLSPRQILQLCHGHRQRCLAKGRVTEVTEFKSDEEGQVTEIVPADAFTALDERFRQCREEADPSFLLAERAEDERLAPLLRAGCRCLVRENPLPASVDAIVDTDFTGGKTTRALHARLRLVYHDEKDREEHFCLRALQRRHASAFQSRLKAAMTQSGIDRRLRFRRLTIIRTGNTPGGNITAQLIDKFKRSGGQFFAPSEDDLRTLWALSKAESDKDPNLVEWLRERRPASKLALMQQAVPVLCQGVPAATAPAPQAKTAPSTQQELPLGDGAAKSDTDRDQKPSSTTEKPPARPASPPPRPSPIRPAEARQSWDLPLGRRLVANKAGEPIMMPAQGLEKHTVILAGSGSGKTVLLRRLVEELVLLGIPSIVIDCPNQLVTLDEPWPTGSREWPDGEQEKARQYLESAEVVVWTPGREAGNPLTLEPLPDLPAVADDEDQLTLAIEMARESLGDVVAPGATQTAKKKGGILSKALRFFARQGGRRLEDLVALLEDLPPEAGLGVARETRLAKEMADSLRVRIETNPLLRGTGASLDPAVLFGDIACCKRTRVSVISFIGLPTLEAQRQFLNQLAMTLFSWVNKNPSPPGRPLRGILAIDEAKDFVPSQKTTACKSSLMRLTAQARRFHLGVLFATQNPKEIENTIIGNCSTHYYGKANAPAGIEVIRDQIRQRGGTGDDIPTLPRGRFYVYNAEAEMRAPTKVLVPLCLSHHRSDPLEEAEILRRAAESRLKCGAAS